MDIEKIRNDVLSYTNGILELGKYEKVFLENESDFMKNIKKYNEKTEKAFLREKDFSIHINKAYLEKTKRPIEMAKSIIAYFQPALFVISIDRDCSLKKCSLLCGISKGVEIDTLKYLKVENLERILKNILYKFDNLGYKLYQELKKKAEDEKFREKLFLDAGFEPRVEAEAKNMDDVKKSIEKIRSLIGGSRQFRDIKKELYEIEENFKRGGATKDLNILIRKLINNGEVILKDDDPLGGRSLEKSEVRTYISLVQDSLDKFEEWAKSFDKLPKIQIYNLGKNLVLKAALTIAVNSNNFDKTLEGVVYGKD